MNSRMDRYNNQVTLKERTARNRKLYDNVQDMNIDYVNIDVNNSVEIDPNKKLTKNRSDYQKLKQLDFIIERKNREIEQPKEEIKEKKVYDINEIMESARKNKKDDDKKRLLNTEYNILTKLDLKSMEDSVDLSTANLRALIDSINNKEEEKKPKTVKKSRVIDDDKDLFDDLVDDDSHDLVLTEDLSKAVLENQVKSSNNEDVNKEVETSNTDIEIKKKKPIEESTTLVNELEKTKSLEIYEKKSKKVLIFVIIVVSILILVGGYFIYEEICRNLYNLFII